MHLLDSLALYQDSLLADDLQKSSLNFDSYHHAFVWLNKQIKHTSLSPAW